MSERYGEYNPIAQQRWGDPDLSVMAEVVWEALAPLRTPIDGEGVTARATDQATTIYLHVADASGVVRATSVDPHLVAFA